jgi:hypothetical protein
MFELLHFLHAATVAGGVAEMCGQEGLDQLPGERRTDDLSTQTKNIHVVVFDALASREDIVDEPGADTVDFVGGNGCAHSAATQGYPALNLSRGNSPGKWDDEVGIVIRGVQLMRAEVYDLVAGSAQRLLQLSFQGKRSMVRRNSYAHHDFLWVSRSR